MPATTERRYKGERVSARVERVAAWVLDLWAGSAMLSYGETNRRIMKHFGCGLRLAIAAQKVATSAEAERAKLTREKLTIKLDDLAERAKAEGKLHDAVNAYREIGRIHGMHAIKVEHSGAVGLDLSKLSDEELEAELERMRALEANERARKG